MQTAFGVAIDLHPIDREFFGYVSRLGRCGRISFTAFTIRLETLVRTFMARGVPAAIAHCGVRLARLWREIAVQVMA
ncbi:MAG: hypothetical protein ABL901_12650 [Hyphomicrobiaceae bacterium]